MSANEVLIRHGGYTDTAYSTCGYKHCNDAVLLAVGVSAADLELYGNDLNDHPVGDDTYVTVASLGETDRESIHSGWRWGMWSRMYGMTWRLMRRKSLLVIALSW